MNVNRDEAYQELEGLGYSGALEDMLYEHLGGTGALEDRIFAEDDQAGGVPNFIK